MTLRCPRCHSLPVMDENVLTCGRGCFTIGGATPDLTIQYWNYIINFVRGEPDLNRNPLASTKEEAIFRGLHDLQKGEL